MKSRSTAYLLWFFLGIWGAHKFYLDKVGTGIFYFFTFGFFFIGWFIDLFTLGNQVDTYNALHGRNFPQANNISKELHRLYELKEKGILSEEEYNQQKRRLMA